MDNNTKKVRGARATPTQLASFISFLESEKGLAEGKFAAQHGKDEAKKKWCQIAEELNCLPGATKSAEQWQVVWRDVKSKVSTKFKTLRRERNATGNRESSISSLTEFEIRVVNLVGLEYMEGNSGCPDSMETNNSQCTEPLVLNEPLIDDVNETENDSCVIINIPQVASTSMLNPTTLGTELSSSSNPRKQSNRSLPTQPPKKRINKDDAVKTEFLKIAKTQADALMTLANAQKEQSTANLLIAESLTKIADALISQKKIEDALLEIKNMVSLNNNVFN